MENSLLWTAFTALNNLERKHLGQWLKSPFYCRKPEPYRLFQYLKQCVDENIAPDQEAARRFVGAPASAAIPIALFRLTMSELLDHLERFLVYRETEGSVNGFEIALAAAYRKRGLDKHFQRSMREARKWWDGQSYRHAEYFEAQANIEMEAYHAMSTGSRTEELNWQALSDMTDLAFIGKKLRQACFALSHQAVYNVRYDFGLLDAILPHLSRHPPLLDYPAVSLYYYCYRFMTEQDSEPYFRQFKPLLFANNQTLPAEEQRNLHLLAINYCIKKVNLQQQEYLGEALDLYKSALQSDLLLENGMLSHFAYNNIAAIALKENELDWAAWFIERYASLLEKKQREAAYHLNLARLAYTRRQYREALLHLQGADYKDLINNLIAKTLQMKIYFETDEYDALDAHLQSMQAFLRRQREIGYHHQNYRNIIRLMRKLMYLPAGQSAHKQLLEEITQTNPLTEKEWFLDKLANA